MSQQGIVFNIQRFSTDDGGGIRTCVFLKGCPLRCAWCHNAEGLSSAPEIALYSQNCIGCGTCISACPQGALSLTGGKVNMNRAKCVACGSCADACPSGTLVTIGKKMSVDEVMETVRRDRIFYGENGGLTITGGEPMAQAAFTLALAEAAKTEGISVAVETSGYGKTKDYLSLTHFCDLFLFDCKASSQQHLSLTGVKDDFILENLNAICESGVPVILRCPVIADTNLNTDFIQKIITLAKQNDAIEAVQLMPYHATGAGKSALLGKKEQATFETPRKEVLMKIAKEIEEKSNKKCFY